ncbi:MAG: hypothetical protein COB02_09985 [Candidatus Cloacimonadota bacterium]|nr:MAG: hypothetical protein COB02_09985 [Candidatus Cloacimonadota bacterium]
MFLNLTSSKTNKGNILVMTLAIVVTFSTISIAINDLIVSQAKSIEYLVAQTQLEYVAHAGLIEAENKLTDDISRTLVLNKTFATFKKKFCVAWTTIPDSGELICNSAASPNQPCCTFTEFGQCDKTNIKGICESENYWQASYLATYDSLNKVIITSANIEFIEDIPDDTNYTPFTIRFYQNKEMALSWE